MSSLWSNRTTQIREVGKWIRNLGKRIGSKGRASGARSRTGGTPRAGRGGLRPRGPAPRLPRKGESGPPCGRPPGDPRDGTLSEGGGAWRPAFVPSSREGRGDGGRRPARAINGRLRTGADKGNPTV